MCREEELLADYKAANGRVMLMRVFPMKTLMWWMMMMMVRRIQCRSCQSYHNKAHLVLVGSSGAKGRCQMQCGVKKFAGINQNNEVKSLLY